MVNTGGGLASKRTGYLPALSYDWLTPLYDPLVRLTTREQAFKRGVIAQAGLRAGQRVLDLGCGTGTLMLLARAACPGVNVVGLDGDPNILRIARSKGDRRGDHLPLVCGLSRELPYADASFDRVLSTLMLHHLSGDEKQRTLREVIRVLRPGGEMHVADWGKPHTRLMAAASAWLRFGGHHHDRISDNLSGRLPELFRGAGFDAAQESVQFSTCFGTLALYRARKPG